MTFVKRHLPLSNGSDKHFRGELKNPKSWGAEGVTIKKTVRYKKSTVKIEKPAPLPSSTVMNFDKTTGELLEFVDLTDK